MEAHRKSALLKDCHEKNVRMCCDCHAVMVGADEAPRGLHRRQDMRGAPAEIPQPGARGWQD